MECRKNEFISYFKKYNTPHKNVFFVGKKIFACHLHYPELKLKDILTIKNKLSCIEKNEEYVFNVSGNGWGTGISLMFKK